MFISRLLFSSGIENAVGIRRVLFVGMSPTVVQISNHIQRHPELGFSGLGYLDAEPEPVSRSTRQHRLGSVAELSQIVDETQPHWIVVRRGLEVPPERVEDFLELRYGGVQTADAAAVYEMLFGRVCATELGIAEAICSYVLRPDPFIANLQSLYSTVFGVLAVIAFSPVMAMIAIILKVTRRGPILSRELRNGLRNSTFTMYRFRCMAEPGRGTGFERFLKRYSLDALPELFNVVAGDMLFIGPKADRPELAARMSQLLPLYKQRQLVKPGIVGWAQVHDDQVPLRDTLLDLEYDLYYIKNLAPSLDLLILFRAIRVFFRDRPGTPI